MPDAQVIRGKKPRARDETQGETSSGRSPFDTPEVEPPRYQERYQERFQHRPPSMRGEEPPSEPRYRDREGSLSANDRKELIALARDKMDQELIASVLGSKKTHPARGDSGIRGGFSGVKAQLQSFGESMKEIQEVYGALAQFNSPSPFDAFMNSPLGASLGQAVGQTVPGMFDVWKQKATMEMNYNLQERSNQRFMDMNEKMMSGYQKMLESRKRQLEYENTLPPTSRSEIPAMPPPPTLVDLMSPQSVTPAPGQLAPQQRALYEQALRQQQEAGERDARARAGVASMQDTLYNQDRFPVGPAPAPATYVPGQSPPIPPRMVQERSQMPSQMMPQNPVPSPPPAAQVNTAVMATLTSMNKALEKIVQHQMELDARISSMEGHSSPVSNGEHNPASPPSTGDAGESVEVGEGDEEDEEEEK